MKGGVFVFAGVCLILTCVGVSSTRVSATDTTPVIIINELAWAGSSSSSQDEWIELKNTSGADIDLAGWSITKDTSGDGTGEILMLQLDNDPADPTSTIIEAGGYFLIANNPTDYDFGDGKLSVLNIEPDVVDSSVTLSNSKLLIRIYDGDWDTGGTVVDWAGDGGAPLAGSNSAKTSMERNQEFGLGDLADSWHEATEAINLDAGVFDKGTPAAPNSSQMLPAPTIISISPDSQETGGILEVEEILGSNFSTAGSTVLKLVMDSYEIVAESPHVASDTLIDAGAFNLSSAETGWWDLLVINPDLQIATLPHAVEILEAEEEIVYSDAIIISELYPKPDTSSNDEFIELHNTGSSSVNLRGWKIDDQDPGGSAEYTVGQDLIIAPGEYVAMDKPQTHIALNDSGDCAHLRQPDGNLIYTVPCYSAAREGESYAYVSGIWQWTRRVTKSYANILELDEDEEDAEEEEVGEMNISLDFDDLSDSSVLLTWDIDHHDAIQNVSIYLSDQEEKAGTMIATVSADDLNYRAADLDPNTQYFFTLTANYLGQIVRSNQVEITTEVGEIVNIGELGMVVINEILPNPAVGEDEFIELYNPGSQSVDIAGWKLADASGRSYIINALDLPPIAITTLSNQSVILPAHQYVLLEQSLTGIHLNNSGGEELYLMDTEDNIIDQVTYESSAKKGFAYVLAPNGKWFWSEEDTPGEANDISFAGITDDADENLTASGPDALWLWAMLISLTLTAIIWTRKRKHAYAHNYKS